MNTLVVIEYDDFLKAEEVRLQFMKMQKEYLVDLEDAVIATKDKDGKVKLHQIHSTVKAGAVSGGFWGALIGLIFLNPLLGMAIGAAGGAAGGALTDVGTRIIRPINGRAWAARPDSAPCSSHLPPDRWRGNGRE